MWIWIFLLGVWVLQSGFSIIQLRYFYRYLQRLRKSGERVSVGKAGKFFRVYVLVAKNQEHQIIRVEQMSGATVFARFKPLDPVFFDNNKASAVPPEKVPPGVWEAFQNALNSI